MRETQFRYLPCFPINRKRPAHWLVFAGRVNGRDDRIRTCGLIVPNDARYQTVPHPDNDMYSINFPAKKQVFIFQCTPKSPYAALLLYAPRRSEESLRCEHRCFERGTALHRAFDMLRKRLCHIIACVIDIEYYAVHIHTVLIPHTLLFR